MTLMDESQLSADDRSTYEWQMWIPGLGEYLGSPVVEREYRGYDGSPAGEIFKSDGTFMDVLTASDGPGSTNFARTFVYRHLNGGYAVYTRMESDTADSDTIDGSGGYAFTGSPAMPPSVTLTGRNIYIVRK